MVKLKKIIALVLAILVCGAGCGKKDAKDVIKNFSDKVNNTKSYTVKGNMEIYAEEETFTYSIVAEFLKDNFYKVAMVNQTNNHEQILLRNEDAVYVITPSLNKSFKFQSEWPDNSSQSYLLKAVVTDMNNDQNSSLEEVENNYIIKSNVNYPNNPELKYQKVTLDKDGNLKKNEIYDEKDTLKMKVTFTSIDYNSSLKESDFKLEEYIKEEDEQDNTENNSTDTKNESETTETESDTSKTNNENETESKEECSEEACKEEQTSCEGDACDKETSSLKDIMYPLYIPSNTYLSTSDKVNTDNGDRIILTFGGEKNFVLVEEKVSASEEFEIIPVYGDPLIVNDTLGALGANSLSWTKDNISYYLAGNDLTTAELISIGKSIRSENITVSKEK